MKREKGQINKEIAWLRRDKYQGQASEAKSNFERDRARLQAGEPIDYVIGWKDFLDCKIDLSYRPLIPREETEFWVGQAIKQLNLEVKPPSGTKSQLGGFTSKCVKVLDLFAGSGCVGLAVLKHCPNVQMTFADKEKKCVRQIKKNLKLNKFKAKVVQADIFKGLGKFDIIFANPPYISTQKSKVQSSVKDWEPKEALFSGADGLVIIRKFLKEAPKHLNSACPEQGRRGGSIYLEFGYGQKKAIEGLLKKNKYKNWEFKKDQFGRFRVVVIQ